MLIFIPIIVYGAADELTNMGLSKLQKIDILKSFLRLETHSSLNFLMMGVHNLHHKWCVIKNISSISVLWPCIQRSMSPLLKQSFYGS